MEEEDREMDNEENRDPEVPNFAHIGPTVRKKEERKKLLGFDCKECQEYYQGKLEDGCTKDQIVQISWCVNFFTTCREFNLLSMPVQKKVEFMV